MKFKEWYEMEYGVYPSPGGEEISVVHRRLADAFSRYVDLYLESFKITERIKTPDTIDWSHVAPEFKYMARDMHGRALLYQNKPRMLETVWVGHPNTFADYFLSYRKGTVDWKDSLVIRPGCE